MRGRQPEEQKVVLPVPGGKTCSWDLLVPNQNKDNFDENEKAESRQRQSFIPDKTIWMKGSFVKLFPAYSQGKPSQQRRQNCLRMRKEQKTISSFLMSPSACRTRKKRKAPVRKELQTQICWTITRTWIMTNVTIMTIVITIMTTVTTIMTIMIHYDDSHHDVNRTKFLSELQGCRVIFKRNDPRIQW